MWKMDLKRTRLQQEEQLGHCNSDLDKSEGLDRGVLIEQEQNRWNGAFCWSKSQIPGFPLG